MTIERGIWNRVPKIDYPTIVGPEDIAITTRIRNGGKSRAASVSQAIIDEVGKFAYQISLDRSVSEFDKTAIEDNVRMLSIEYAMPAIYLLEAEQVIRGSGSVMYDLFAKIYNWRNKDTYINLREIDTSIILNRAVLVIQRHQYAYILIRRGPLGFVDYLVESQLQLLSSLPEKYIAMTQARIDALEAGKRRFIQLYNAVG